MARNDAALQKLKEETLALMANGQLDLFKYRTAKAALPLTHKQLVFVSVYAETGDRTRAANVAYDCANDDVARVMAHRQLHNPKVLNYLEKLLEPQTLYNMVLNTYRDGMRATKTKKVNGRLTKVPDYRTRKRSAKLLLPLIDPKRGS